ncbi:MAG: YggS family pyridoxal phosphate-dependent enzyme [Candidatus Omnitrophota bacterium]
MDASQIKQNAEKILRELPGNVELVAAAKARTPEEVLGAVEGGVGIIGENYVQEAAEAFAVVGRKVRWHFIGHLQKNKVKKAVEIFDVIETIDSVDLAEEVDKRCGAIGKTMPVLVEINSGREPQKFGVLPEEASGLIEKIAKLPNVKVKGLMTMGPFTGDPEDARSYFVETRKVFNDLKENGVPGAEMKYLSMGMTNSYLVAIEEGANMVRIGTKIFGERE